VPSCRVWQAENALPLNIFNHGSSGLQDGDETGRQREADRRTQRPTTLPFSDPGLPATALRNPEVRTRDDPGDRGAEVPSVGGAWCCSKAADVITVFVFTNLDSKRGSELAATRGRRACPWK